MMCDDENGRCATPHPKYDGYCTKSRTNEASGDVQDSRHLTRTAFAVHSHRSGSLLKPMKILRFPVRRHAAPEVAGRITSLQTLLSECLSRQTRLHEDGRRLRQSLDRLAVLARDMVRSTEVLKVSADRLRSCHRRFGPK